MTFAPVPASPTFLWGAANETCSVKTGNPITTGGRSPGIDETDPSIVADVPIVIQNLSNDKGVGAGGIYNDRRTHRAWLPTVLEDGTNVIINPRSWIEIGTIRYEIEGAGATVTEQDGVQQVDLRRVD